MVRIHMCGVVCDMKCTSVHGIHWQNCTVLKVGMQHVENGCSQTWRVFIIKNAKCHREKQKQKHQLERRRDVVHPPHHSQIHQKICKNLAMYTSHHTTTENWLHVAGASKPPAPVRVWPPEVKVDKSMASSSVAGKQAKDTDKAKKPVEQPKTVG